MIRDDSSFDGGDNDRLIEVEYSELPRNGQAWGVQNLANTRLETLNADKHGPGTSG